MTDDTDQNLLVRNQHVVESLERSLRSGQHGLDVVPGLLHRCLTEESWREFVTQRGERVQHDRFIDFVMAPPLKGLGTTDTVIKRLIADDSEALDLLDHALTGAHGARPQLADTRNEVEHPTSASRDQTLRRLLKDAPKLHAEVIAGRLSVNKAMVEAGLRPATANVRLDDPVRTAQALRRRLGPEQIQELVKALMEDAE